MTLIEAIKKTECLEVDYDGMGFETQEEVEEFDNALDLIFKAAREVADQRGETK